MLLAHAKTEKVTFCCKFSRACFSSRSESDSVSGFLHLASRVQVCFCVVCLFFEKDKSWPFFVDVHGHGGQKSFFGE